MPLPERASHIHRGRHERDCAESEDASPESVGIHRRGDHGTERTAAGSGAVDGTYRMPSPDLPKLAGGSDGFQELVQHEPEASAFMSQVRKETARLLGMKPWDDSKESGFSCFGCHVRR